MKEDRLFPIGDLMQKRNWSLGELLAMAEEHPGNYGMYLGEFTSRMESYATRILFDNMSSAAALSPSAKAAHKTPQVPGVL